MARSRILDLVREMVVCRSFFWDSMVSIKSSRRLILCIIRSCSDFGGIGIMILLNSSK